MDDFIHQLGWFPGGTFTIHDMQMVAWGRSLIFGCRYALTADEQKTFDLVFEDCRDIKYKVYAHMGLDEFDLHSPAAEVGEIMIGQGHHRRDAHLLTNHFAVTISYGTLYVEIGTERRILSQ